MPQTLGTKTEGMKIGPIILLVWILLLSSAVLAAIVMAIVRGATSLRWGVLTILGTVLYYGFISAGLGVSEGVLTFTSTVFLIAVTIGIAGVALSIIGIRGFFRTRARRQQNETKT